MGKLFSGYATDTAPTTDDKVAGYDSTTGANRNFLLSDLITLFQSNPTAGAYSVITRDSENMFDHVASGGVWSGDSYGVTRAASMTAMVIYINGRRISIAAVTARTFTASKDTYIDVLDNLDGTGTLVYTEVANNAASPALASNSVRIGIIVTGATTIAAVGSVNQGQQDKVLPIAASTPYAVTDSLGNLICPRDPQRRILGYRQILSNATGTTQAQITGLSAPVIVPTGRKIKINVFSDAVANATAGRAFDITIWDGTVAIGTLISTVSGLSTGAGQLIPINGEAVTTPASASKVYNAALANDGSGTITFRGNASYPGFIKVELA